MNKDHQEHGSPLDHEHRSGTLSTDSRLVACRRVLHDCFWNDYQLTDEMLLHRIKAEDIDFMRFLFSKIIENSPHPSREIRILFPRTVWEKLLTGYMKRSKDKKHIRLVAANLTGNYDLVPEVQWKR